MLISNAVFKWLSSKTEVFNVLPVDKPAFGNSDSLKCDLAAVD